MAACAACSTTILFGGVRDGRSCARKRQAGDALFSLVLGWWGFPWGLIMTPVQIGRNVVGMFRNVDSTGPSENLERAVGMALASQWARDRQSQRQ